MIVSDVTSRRVGGSRLLSARALFENPTRDELPVWLYAHGDATSAPACADPLLAGLLVPCMILHEDLEIDAPVTASVLEAATRRIAPMVRRWHSDCEEIAVRCRDVVEADAPSPRSTGCFFSGGVDSWYSLLKNADSATHLICIHGLEIESRNQPRWNEARAYVRDVASDRGKELTTIATNLREVAVLEVVRRLELLGRPRPMFGLECYFGNMLVAAGLHLRPGFGRIFVPSSWPYERVRPAGSHPLLEPRWSTDGLEFEVDGCEASRIEKIRTIASTCPEALARLRVCVTQESSHLNCGRCVKCVRTRLEMRAAGLAPGLDTFAELPGLDEVKRMRFPIDDHLWPDVLREARAAGDAELVETVEVLMGRRLHWPRLRDDVERARSKRSRRLARRWLKKRLFGREHRHRPRPLTRACPPPEPAEGAPVDRL